MSREDRLEEELFCLATWLSLNAYEERARKSIVEELKNAISKLSVKHSCFVIGSVKSGLYGLDIELLA